jgi:shikimate kinase
MLDLDEYISGREGRSIQAIIDEEGEAQFRETETHALREALENETARVIALGGGTWANARNRALITEYRGFTIWLDTPFELCWQRIKRAGDTRPLARDREGARQLYEKRRGLYSLAPSRVRINKVVDAEMIVIEVMNALGHYRMEDDTVSVKEIKT